MKSEVRSQKSEVKSQKSKVKGQKSRVGIRLSPISYRLPALCSLVFALCSVTSIASGQSFFSSRGFGEEITNSDAASGALGGLFTASSRNPAYPVGTPKTNFTASALVLGNYATDGANQRVLGDVRPNFLRVRVPLPVGLRLNLGLSEWFN